MNFSYFDGENPKLCISYCEDYCGMYSIEPHMWIKVMTMHLSTVATHWLQSIEQRVKSVKWEEIFHMILKRFGKDQYEMFIT
jgi:hypothetical protein